MSASEPAGFSANNISFMSVLMVICIISSIGLFIYSNIMTSGLIGDTENWRAIKPQVKRIWWQTAIGSVLLFIGMFVYVIQDNAASVKFILIISCISLALSFASISMAAISTSGAAPST